MKAIISQNFLWQFLQCTWIPRVLGRITRESGIFCLNTNSSRCRCTQAFYILCDGPDVLLIHPGKKWMRWQLKRRLCISRNRSLNVGVIWESAVSKPQICLAEELSKLHFMLWLQCATSALYRICSLVGWVPFPVSILISGRVNREHRPTQLPPGSSQAVLLTVALTAREH